MSATDVYQLVGKPECERGIFLRSFGVEGAEPSAFERMLFEMGQEHENRHLQDYRDAVDTVSGTLEENAQATREIVSDGRIALHQGVLLADYPPGAPDAAQLVGIPDFMIPVDGSYVLRDTKLGRAVGPNDREDIDAQIQFYAYLYERTFGDAPAALEVVAGDGVIHTFTYRGPEEVEERIERIVDLKTAGSEPICDVKWSSKGSCKYFDRCWAAATDSMQLSIVPGLMRSAVEVLRRDGIVTIPQLLEAHDEQSLGDVKIPWGTGEQRLGKRAIAALNSAAAIHEDQEIVHRLPSLSPEPHIAMFDLEGMPPLGDSPGYIYLWGTSVDGSDPLPYDAAFAISEDGLDDHAGWIRFLERARAIFDRYGSIPWVHWASYEKTHMNQYIGRHGDVDGIAQQVVDSLVDLLPKFKSAVTPPVYSYSLKEIEKYVGFERSQEEIGGDWSIAVWRRVVKSASSSERQQLLDELATYNREDLEGMAAVYEYMKQIRAEH